MTDKEYEALDKAKPQAQIQESKDFFSFQLKVFLIFKTQDQQKLLVVLFSYTREVFTKSLTLIDKT